MNQGTTARRIAAIVVLSGAIGIAIGAHAAISPVASVSHAAVVFQPADAQQTPVDTSSPSPSPTASDTSSPSDSPTVAPTASSTASGTQPTDAPQPTSAPTADPTNALQPTDTPAPTPVPCDTSVLWSGKLVSAATLENGPSVADIVLGPVVSASKDVGSRPVDCHELVVTVNTTNDYLPPGLPPGDPADGGNPIVGTPVIDVVFDGVSRSINDNTTPLSVTLTDQPSTGDVTVAVKTNVSVAITVAWSPSW
jgi:hypothetical protein